MSVPSWIRVFAPSATINGNHTLADDSSLHVHAIEISSGTAVSKTAGTGEATIAVDHMHMTSAANGVLCTSGHLNLKADHMAVVTGYAIGSTSTQEVNAFVNEIELNGAGFGVGIVGAGTLKVSINCIACGGTGTAIYLNSSATVIARIGDINANTAYNVVDSGSTLYLFVNSLTGTETNNGTVYLTEAGLPETVMIRYDAPTGVTINKNDVVYQTATADEVNKARANAFATSKVVGIAAETFSNGATGRVIMRGLVEGVGSGWTAGAAIYLSTATAGATQTALPSGTGNYILRLGWAKNATDLTLDPGVILKIP
jgi:hypothetical protein